jgi:hypothetical protein
MYGTVDPPKNPRRKKKKNKDHSYPDFMGQEQKKQGRDEDSTQSHPQKAKIRLDGVFWKMDEDHESGNGSQIQGEGDDGKRSVGKKGSEGDDDKSQNPDLHLGKMIFIIFINQVGAD